MKILYTEFKIMNDLNNNGHLYCHKISQFIKLQLKIENFGIYFDIIRNEVVIRTIIVFDINPLKKFLNKEIIVESNEIEINNRDNLILEIGFKPNHIKNVDKELVSSKDLDQFGYFPNYININNELVHYINKKRILDCLISNLQVTQLENVQLEYFVENKIRRLSINKQTFLLMGISDINEEQLLEAFISGLGVKKSYGFSRIIKI